MDIDIEEMLRRVVADVFGHSIDVEFSHEPKEMHFYRARLTSVDGRPTDVGLRASYEWFDASIFDLVPGVDVRAMRLDYDHVEAEKESILRALAFVLRAYVRGEGHLEYRRTLILRRRRPVYVVNVGGREWRLGRHGAAAHPPN